MVWFFIRLKTTRGEDFTGWRLAVIKRSVLRLPRRSPVAGAGVPEGAIGPWRPGRPDNQLEDWGHVSESVANQLGGGGPGGAQTSLHTLIGISTLEKEPAGAWAGLGAGHPHKNKYGNLVLFHFKFPIYKISSLPPPPLTEGRKNFDSIMLIYSQNILGLPFFLKKKIIINEKVITINHENFYLKIK